jgi:protein ImuB
MWPIERLRRHAALNGNGPAGGVPDDAPLALVETGGRGLIITAVNERAARDGVAVGSSLADARSALPSLLSRPAEPARDHAALLKLCRWMGRYGPNRNIDGADGSWIDVTGVAHLFGGEEGLLRDLSSRLARMGVSARIGLADTLGAAHALARFACTPHRPWSQTAPGETRAALAGLPVAALRLDDDSVLLLRRLGLRRIGQLYSIPRAALERRFRTLAKSKTAAIAHGKAADAVLMRLDLALGLSGEPRRALHEPALLAVRRLFAEPIISSEILEAETARLCVELARALEDQALGCRRIRLSLTRADGTLATLGAGLSTVARDGAHLMSLLKEKLAGIDAGFGADSLVLEAFHAERLAPRQRALGAHLSTAAAEGAAALLDRLTGRLGLANVICLSPRDSHVPEHAEAHLPALHAFRYEPPWPYEKGPPRPALLLSRPEPITVMAEVPEGPPRSFTWRRVVRRIARAEGPERIAPEWWRDFLGGACDSPPASRSQAWNDGVRGRLSACAAEAASARRRPEGESRTPPKPRDYYRVEDEAGGTYWVFREGLYQDADTEGPPRWFLHGLFA